MFTVSRRTKQNVAVKGALLATLVATVAIAKKYSTLKGVIFGPLIGATINFGSDFVFDVDPATQSGGIVDTVIDTVGIQRRAS